MRRALSVAAVILCAQPAFAQECAAPNALLAAGFVEEANAAYRDILAGETALPPKVPTSEERACAIAGLERAHAQLLATKIALGDLHRTAGDKDAAAAEYQEALQLAPDSAAAAHGVRLLQDLAPVTAVERARALSALGMDAEARKALDGAFTADDGSREQVPADLLYLFDAKIPSWDGFLRLVRSWGPPILEMLAGLVLLLALVRLSASAVGLARRTLEIEDFDKGAFDEDHVGKQVSTAIRCQLQRTAKGSRRGRIDLVTGPIQNVELPTQIEAIVPPVPASWLSPTAWINAVSALLLWLIPARAVKLNGTLHKDAKRGVGITALLLRKHQIVASYTFWKNDFDVDAEPSDAEDADAIQQLAEYVAIWLLFEMSEHFKTKLSMLGTSDWQSYALFRAGIFAGSNGRPEAAKRLYERALTSDPKLRGARFNLAMCLARKRDWAGAMEHYVRARDESFETKEYADPTLYSAMYNIAVAEHNNKGAAAAKPQLEALLRRIEETLSLIEQKRKGYRDPALLAHLHKIRPLVRVMLGGLMLETGDPKGLKVFKDQISPGDVSARRQHSLACSYSIAAQTATGPDVAIYLDRSLEFLERAFKLEKALVADSERDVSLAGVRKRRSKRFNDLLAKYGEPDEPDTDEPEMPLAEYDVIGAKYAMQLSGSNIKTPADLLGRTVRPEGRHSLAETLTIATPLVTIWAHAMDLSRIVGLKPVHVNLLALAGVGSLGELENADPPRLTEALTALGAARAETDLPDSATVEQWVNDARKNTRAKVL